MYYQPSRQPPLPSIESVLDLALAYNPSLAMKDISEVYVWLEAGAVIDQDIIPVLKQIMGKKKGISAFSYFRRPVMEAMNKRQVQAKIAEKNKPQSREEKDYLRAKSMAWCRSRGINTTSTDFSWLERYEAKHGTVSG